MYRKNKFYPCLVFIDKVYSTIYTIAYILIANNQVKVEKRWLYIMYRIYRECTV